jgi:hypothetical protein
MTNKILGVEYELIKVEYEKSVKEFEAAQEEYNIIHSRLIDKEDKMLELSKLIFDIEHINIVIDDIKKGLNAKNPN